MSLAFRNFLFSVVVPGLGAVLVPWWVLTRGSATPTPMAWPAAAVIAVGVVLYVVCVWRSSAGGHLDRGMRRAA